MTRFECDERKNLSNRQKHGVTFQQAIDVFFDPYHVSKLERMVDGEQRWQTTGSRRDTLLLVAHTVEEETQQRKSYASFQLALQPLRRGNLMKPKIVSYTFETMPHVSEADEARLKAFAARPASQIDTSDAREMTPEEWMNPERARFYRPVKRQIRATLDAEVLAWLKSQGRGYQSRLNDILRREMLKSLKRSSEDSQLEHTAA